ncbi:MAG: radical SAM protein [Candidatus Freyarchaeota archaeon]|nr:radical SAM protein [Candidatus Jordarchaeia archaeon]
MKKNFVEVLERSLYEPLSLGEAEQLVNCSKCVGNILEAARKVTEERGPRVLRVYAPSSLFPSISVTGARCELNCAHCNRHYLRHMIPAETPEKLYKVCVSLYERGAVGCLISGGSVRAGYVPLEPFVEAIGQVKEETDLILNVHTGLISRELAQRLAEAGVDVASLDVVGDTDTVRMVYGLDRGAEDYFEALKTHVEAGIRHVVPHICVGLHYGGLRGEMKALEAIRRVKPEALVFIVLIPTRGTRMEGVPPPDPLGVVKVVAAARLMLRDTAIILGCMRPPGKIREKLDLLALDIIDGIVLPTRKAIKEAEKRGFTVKRLSACCATPREYESLVEAKQKHRDKNKFKNANPPAAAP